ncbi:MAG: acetyl-CoA acetyltransferase [Candidatus Thermoplasmatota archaeon]|nr:acetyl-CoA acetyltransferase [Candidatus Thermoplasmatota archaeon]
MVGIGYEGFPRETPHYSFKELTFEAALKAYEDAGVDPRKDVDSFVVCEEDYWAGWSISDEGAPDQLGGALRPLFTVSGDGLNGVANAFMLIKTGHYDVVVVESHSKASDILTYEGILTFAFDPIFNRPLNAHPHFLAGLEMDAFLEDHENTEEDCAEVVRKNRENARHHEAASFGGQTSVQEVMDSEVLFRPLKTAEISPLADGSIVLVLASAEKAKELTDQPIWIRGIGWSSDSPWLETRSLAEARYARWAAEQAYRMADIDRPRRRVDVAEVDDRFAYKELQHLEALGLAGGNRAGALLREGFYEMKGDLPANPSGGSLGVGNLLEASGLFRVMEIVRQLQGRAGEHQVDGATLGVAQSWRGIPTATGCVAVLEA